MIHHYFRVYALDKWRMQPLWTRYLYSGFFMLVLGILIPTDGWMLFAAGLCVLAGFGLLGASAFLFLFSLVKKDKNKPLDG